MKRYFFLFPFLAFYSSALPQSYEILGFGDACMDYLVQINDDEIDVQKGSWRSISQEQFLEIETRFKNRIKTLPGGSGANVIKGLAQLGKRCGIIGNLGSDENGKFYSDVLERMGIFSFHKKKSLPTEKIFCFITPDAQRTFLTSFGASNALENFEFDEERFDSIKLFHIEGYQLIDAALFSKAISLAKQKGAKISVDLANYKIVEGQKEFIWKLLETGSIDFLFANEFEAFTLTGSDPETAAERLSLYCDSVVITMSERGSIAQKGAEKIYYPARRVPVIDTTGAGDFFAGGFLYGILENYSIEKCAEIGTLLASHVIQQVGAEIPAEVWDLIKKELEISFYAKNFK